MKYYDEQKAVAVVQASLILYQQGCNEVRWRPVQASFACRVPNLSVTMYPFSIPTGEYVLLQHFDS